MVHIIYMSVWCYVASHITLSKDLHKLKEKPQASMSEQTLGNRSHGPRRRNALITAKSVAEAGPLMKRKLSLPPINPK